MYKGEILIMKFEIMLGILFELLSKRKVKASYLSEKYEVSLRSIYRYVEALEYAGVPLYSTRGKNGGISIVDTYRISSTFMTPTEFEQTINTLTTFEKNVPSKILSSAITKLKSAAKNEFNQLNVQSGNLIIDAGPWGDTVGYKTKIAVIQKSIEQNSLLNIKYHDRNGEVSERKIEPHLIIFKQGLWYCYAYCHLRNSFRFFKTGRIEHATILNEKFSRRVISEDEIPLNFWDNTTVAETVVMKVDKNVLSDVEEWLGIENVTKIKDEFIAQAKLPYDNGLISKIISYGDGVEVLEPNKLRNDIKQKVLSIAKKY